MRSKNTSKIHTNYEEEKFIMKLGRWEGTYNSEQYHALAPRIELLKSYLHALYQRHEWGKLDRASLIKFVQHQIFLEEQEIAERLRGYAS